MAGLGPREEAGGGPGTVASGGVAPGCLSAGRGRASTGARHGREDVGLPARPLTAAALAAAALAGGSGRAPGGLRWVTLCCVFPGAASPLLGLE